MEVQGNETIRNTRRIDRGSMMTHSLVTKIILAASCLCDLTSTFNWNAGQLTALRPSSFVMKSSMSPKLISTDRRGVSRLFSDPYEEQYRKYWNAQQTLLQTEQQQQQQQQHLSHDFSIGVDKQQYNSLCSSQELVPDEHSNYEHYNGDTALQATHDEPHQPTLQYQDATHELSPYELQYRQYLQFLQSEMITEYTNHEEPPNANPESSIVSTSSSTIDTSIQPPPHHQQQTAEPRLIEESSLRKLSNEVQYKKLLKQSPYSLTDIEFPILIQRILDNLEDGTQKRNGKFQGSNKLKRHQKPREGRKTVVVLGTGWAAHAFVKLASTYDLRIVVVSPVNHFVFTPMLASAAVGTVEYRSMTEPIRVTNPYIDNFVEGRAIAINVEERKLAVQLSSLSTVTGAFKGLASTATCRLEPEPVLTHIIYDDENNEIKRDESMGAGTVIELSYDHLICAVGTASRSSMVRGAKEHCFNLKTTQDSKRMRTAIGEALEFASRPDVQEFYYQDEEMQIQARTERQRRMRIAIIGGGPTGVELAGELMDFFSQVCGTASGAFQHLRDDVSVMLVHGGSSLLPAMDSDLRERALEALLSQGVDVRLNTRLNEVGRDYITICKKGSDVEETIPVGITVWAAGNAPVPFVKELLSQLPESAAGSAGRINVDKWLRCPTGSEKSFGSILVLGDVACLETESKYDPEPNPLPQTAQVAGQQGAFAARMLNRGYDLQQTPPKLPELSSSEAASLLRVWLIARGLEECPGFNFLSLGLLAYVGQEEALNQVMLGDVPIFNYSGKIAFALWRSVYLAKQASSRNQALIAFDWARTQTFGRDITRL